MMDIRKRILLIGGIVLLILLIIIFLLVRRSRMPAVNDVVPAPVETTNQETVKTDSSGPIIIKDVVPPPPASPEERQKLYVVQLCKIFVERYLSYSNQDLENGHISDVASLGTARMVSYIETQTEAYSKDYKGVSTKLISSSLDTFVKDKATVKISIQQLLEEKGKSPVTAYKNGKVSLLQEDGVWKVDGLYFDETK